LAPSQRSAVYQETLQGYSVKYVEADSDFAKFGLATQVEQAKILSAYTEPDLLVLDDLFLAEIGPA
jgi:response regulator of citrate/malate metabolism